MECICELKKDPFQNEYTIETLHDLIMLVQLFNGIIKFQIQIEIQSDCLINVFDCMF